jgi:DNA-binding NarL/FixJ family response regulator
MSVITTTDVVSSIDARLAEIDEIVQTLSAEVTNLIQARELLTAESPAKAKRSRKATLVSTDQDSSEVEVEPKTSGKAKKATRTAEVSGAPSKAQQILDLLEEGKSPKEIAEQIGVDTRYVYSVKSTHAKKAE